MFYIERYQLAHLSQLASLVNAHLTTLVPGWALPEHVIAARLERNPGEYVIDPWVVERVTLCAIERDRVVGAAHLLRYGNGDEVSLAYRGAGEVNWLYFWPGVADAARVLLEAAAQQFDAWNVVQRYFEGSAPVGPAGGLPDVWPHVAEVVVAAGFAPLADRNEALFGGTLNAVPVPGAPPLPALRVERSVGVFGTRFAAMLEDKLIGACDCITDLTEGGALPALHGWAELTELEVDEEWRNHGIGSWLVQHAVAWARLGGCDRIVLSVAADDEAAGAGRFYRRCGWDVLAREQRGWKKQSVVSSQ